MGITMKTLGLTLALFVVGSLSESSCPQDWLDGSKVDLGCIYLLKSDLTWQEGLEFCLSHGDAHLVEIKNQEQHDFIITAINITDHGNMFWWLGATDIDSEGDWLWTHSKEPFTYSNWADGQPNDYDGKRNCAMLDRRYQYKWSDGTCTGDIEKVFTICCLH